MVAMDNKTATVNSICQHKQKNVTRPILKFAAQQVWLQQHNAAATKRATIMVSTDTDDYIWNIIDKENLWQKGKNA